ncbi:tRNA (adenosine(37)-N6)-threonylcarbamoyltransferase complex dimerization subunit type 1 TsaB [Aurantiacibacter poecillastricola]|uniref:tRNA (adenosine(37)-N6)-threonylcarbamoyltransferase complex dimerization subunit type 1 TsaB n=1 Tax=Aurantiacibacter poecillastricola TaxID=3064385 RepID=UPI00273E50D5|nr:tRNA (adenosine(37)-N6)-threonylcarbamoyltransferase complex dimerization subunit type 1 TsaB [Aurantiacibacter sp. 219JJ12-13]MDP5261541.1 tRNA (adenosine(37)-N6)-threonylcarbamoyltransferase complex dimerization subunit type 1 TsaB [Aurantiacibacter sp. 219JJ12-13]
MRVLAIDCATEACSAALFDGTQLLEGRCEIIGRGHAERLVPLIAELPAKGRAERIIVSLGPGSFTGVRIGLAAARALGLAWGAEVLGYPTLDLVRARSSQAAPRPVTICMNGGHGEYFLQNFAADARAEDEVRSLQPAEAAQAARHEVIAGNKARELTELLGDGRLALDLLPDANYAHLLDESRLTSDLTPVYGRGPDARLPEVRR